jgi:ADP-ribose pyrophosphatase YjhB (NUDIX family)
MVIRPGVAAVIFDGERVLLQRRDDNGKWGLPGGGVEPGESVRAAVVREVHEETGLDVEPVRLIGVYSDPANHQVITYPDGNVIHYVSTVFECAIRGGALTCGCESLELAFFAPDRLPPDTLPISRIRIADALARQVEAFVR